MKKNETAHLLNARWQRLKSVFTRLAAGGKLVEDEHIPAAVTQPGWIFPKGIGNTIQEMIKNRVSFPTSQAEKEIRPHFFKLWQTELRLGKRADRFEFMSQEQESHLRCSKSFPKQFHLVIALNVLLFPETRISVGPAVGADGKPFMRPLPKPYPVMRKPKFLWVPCVASLTKSENLQRMAAAHAVFTDREAFYKRLESTIAHNHKRLERENFYIIVARFYAAQPDGKRLWNTAAQFYPTEYQQAQTECHKHATREIPADLKQKIVDAVKQGEKIESREEKRLALWKTIPPKRIRDYFAKAAGRASRVGTATPQKRKIS